MSWDAHSLDNFNFANKGYSLRNAVRYGKHSPSILEGTSERNTWLPSLRAFGPTVAPVYILTTFTITFLSPPN